MIKSRILKKGDYPGLSRWDHYNYQDSSGEGKNLRFREDVRTETVVTVMQGHCGTHYKDLSIQGKKKSDFKQLLNLLLSASVPSSLKRQNSSTYCRR